MAKVEVTIEVKIPGTGYYSTHVVWPVEDCPEGHTQLEMAATAVHQFAAKMDKMDAGRD